MARRLTILAALSAGCLGVWLFLLWLEGTYREKEDEKFSLIEPGLYLGRHVEQPPSGTQFVLNLCEAEDSYHCETHVWEPIRDSAPAPDIDWLQRMVELIDANRKTGRVTYVHCRNGVSRSAMVVTAYEMRKNRWTRDEALAFVRSKRQIVRPNPAFMERLLEWECVLGLRPVDSND